MRWYRWITLILVGVVLTAGNLDFSGGPFNAGNRVEAAGQRATNFGSLGDRFGFVGDFHTRNITGNPYYLYRIGDTSDPTDRVRMAGVGNGGPNTTDRPEQVTFAPDYSYWLIGNEPDATATDPAVYADLTYRWYVRLKSLNPTAQVYVGQTAFADTDYLNQWWKAYSDKYGFPPFDGYTVHAYTTAAAPFGVDAVPNAINAMRQWMKNKGVGNKSLWLTEYGVLTGRDANGNIQWDSLVEYMRKTNGWLIANTDKVQRWFWFADFTHDGSSCWTGDLYNVYLNASCDNPSTNDGSLSSLGQEYLTEINGLNSSSPQSYLPQVTKNAFGGWSSKIHLRNNGTSSGLVTVTYYDQDGKSIYADMRVVPAAGSVAVSLAGNAYLPDGFSGSAVVSSPEPVVATVDQLPASGDGMSYNGEKTGSTRVYLPVALNDAYGGWTSGINVMNVSDSPARVNIAYYDLAGRAVGSEDRNDSLAPKAYWPVFQGAGQLPDGFAGSAVVSSNQPVVAVVNEICYARGATGATSYNGLASGAATTYFPAVMNNAYGGWTTGINLKNLGSTASDVTISYFDGYGRPAGRDRRTIPAGGYWGVYQGSGQLPDGFVGSARVDSTQPAAAIVNEINRGMTEAMSYEGHSQGAQEAYLPIMFKGAAGGWSTGINLMNLGNAATVSIDYYDAYGRRLATDSRNVETNGYWGVYQGGSPLPAGFDGTAIIRSGQPIVAIANQISDGGISMSYAGIASR